jgi:flagellar protein FliO/FliZ
MRLILALTFLFSMSAQAAEDVAAKAETNSSDKAAITETVTTSDKKDDATATAAATAANASADKPKVDNRKESEIPLNLEAKKTASSEGVGVFRIVMTLAVLGLVGAGAFFFLRKYAVPKAKQHQTQIKVLQQHFLGPKKSLAIVRVAGESILIGVTDHNINMIKSLALLDDEVPEETPKNFNKVLGGFSLDQRETEESSTAVKASNRKSTSSKELDPDEEFAISGIKDIVSKRLKGMRSFQ